MKSIHIKTISLIAVILISSFYSAQTNARPAKVLSRKEEKLIRKKVKYEHKLKVLETKKFLENTEKYDRKISSLNNQIAKVIKKLDEINNPPAPSHELQKKQSKASKPESKSEAEQIQSIKLNATELEASKQEEQDKFTALEQELKESERKALEFILPSVNIDDEELETKETYFSETEKEQLLELWRATLARNRTIQFVIKMISNNPDDLEQNNAIIQGLSRALFVPFYAVSAIANNTLVSGGSAVGARVIGDVVDASNEKRDRTKQITRTDLMVLFMLVDQVAERLRSNYYNYKQQKITKELLAKELIPARIDASEAFEKDFDSSIFFTRMVVRDIERKARENDIAYRSSRRVLEDLAGKQAIDSVDLLIDLEVEEILSDITGI